MNFGGSYASSANTFTLLPESGGRVESSPKGLIATKASETKEGWYGLVYVDKQIVHQTEVQTDSDVAMRLANEYVIARVTALFSDG